MSSWQIKLNAAFQFEWIKNVFLQSLRIIMKSFFFNFLLFSSVVMNLCKALQTNRHLQRLLTSRLIRMFSVMWWNPGFVNISSNILDFVLILTFPQWGQWASDSCFLGTRRGCVDFENYYSNIFFECAFYRKCTTLRKPM